MKFPVLAILAVLLSQLSSTALASDWKFGLGGGIALPSYPTTIQTALDAQTAANGSKRTPATGRLGVYLPRGSRSLWGMTVVVTSDIFSGTESSSRITQFALCGSTMKFFGPSESTGIFVGADLGAAMATASNSVGRSASSGIGGMLGAQLGYAWDPVVSGHPVLLSAASSVSFIEGETYRTLSLLAGVLF